MELEDHLFFLCTQVVYRRTRLLNDALKPLELLPTEYRVLSALLRKGPLTMLDLAQWTAYERTRLTHILHAMEEKGWISRAPSQHDRRTVVVQISPEGGALFKSAKTIVDRITRVILSENDPADIEVVRKALRTMRSKLIEMGT